LLFSSSFIRFVVVFIVTQCHKAGSLLDPSPGTNAGPASTIDLRAIRLEKRDRTQALRRLLKDHPEWDRVLVFVATRYAAEHVTGKLRRAGILARELHGKLDQDARMRRLADLKPATRATPSRKMRTLLGNTKAVWMSSRVLFCIRVNVPTTSPPTMTASVSLPI
jgi:superfamily II DNA/RNA helicase